MQESKGAALENLPDHSSVYVRQPEIAARISIGQAFVIESQLMQHGGVEIVHRHFVFRHRHRKFVGRSVGHAPTNSTPGHPNGVAVNVMIPSYLGRILDRLHGGSAAHLATPDDERFIQHSPLLQIGQQRGDWPVRFTRQTSDVADDGTMVVPGLPTTVITLDITNTPLRQASRVQHVAALRRIAV